MRLVRFSHAGVAHYGRAEDELIYPVRLHAEKRELVDAPPVARSTTTPLPLVDPSKIVCIGVNYWIHAEYGHAIPSEPLIFLKPPSAVVDHGQPIEIPAESNQVEYEGELGVVIGRRTRSVTPGQALNHVLGYCCANDVSARDIQNAENNNFGRAKSFDTFAPVGPWIETAVDPDQLLLETFVDGRRVQSASTADMVFSVAQLIAAVSRVMTLLPGDLIMTGTPDGMGPIEAGNRVDVCLSGIGTLSNPVVNGAGRPALKAAEASTV